MMQRKMIFVLASRRSLSMRLSSTTVSTRRRRAHYTPQMRREYSIISTSTFNHCHEEMQSRTNNHQLECRRQLTKNAPLNIFVSEYNSSIQLSSQQIQDWCRSHGIDKGFRTTSSHVILQECPFCTKPTNNKQDNLYKLYIQLGQGAYFCHRCGAKGSWFDFKTRLSSDNSNKKNDRSSSYNNITSLDNTFTSSPQKTKKLPLPNPKVAAMFSTDLLDKEEADNDALGYLTNVRGLTKATLRKYCVGRAYYKFPSEGGRYIQSECVTFPWTLRVSELQQQEALQNNKSMEPTASASEEFVTNRLKVRALSNKAWQRLDPPGGGWGFFGWHTVPKDATEIIITEGEYDAMAVYQATGRPAISLPNGCRSLPLQVLPVLERFSKIYLWMDNDGPGREGAEQFAKKMGVNRCYIVTSSAKDANEALLLDMDLEHEIQTASLLPHEQLVSFSELRQQIVSEIVDPDKYAGVPCPSLPTLTKLLKGFRRGEMTVVTGPTGSGKTTFLSQLSLDFVEQGVPTLWGSFEIKNTRLMLKLLQQYSKQPLPDFSSSTITEEVNKEKLNALLDRFQNLPLQFMKFHGGSDIDDVLDAMEYAAYVHDTQHFILDNMQFMISRHSHNNSRSFDKFDVQDMAVEKFRKFATEQNVHVTLVVHPRKEDEFQKLSISSIYGSAKATQEADTVLILQNDGRRKFIDVKKNRFDGTTGIVPLHFERQSNRYTEQPTQQTHTNKNKKDDKVHHGNAMTARKVTNTTGDDSTAKATSLQTAPNAYFKDIMDQPDKP